MKKKYGAENIPKTVILLTVTLTILARYYYPYLGQWISSPSLSPNLSPDDNPLTEKVRVVIRKCDIFKGEWVPNPRAPYYTNETCWAIYDQQNCMKFGKPDTNYMKWRWRPYDCELSIFNPAQFLELVRGKSMAFIGDSVGRNQMQSLLCLLSRVLTYFKTIISALSRDVLSDAQASLRSNANRLQSILQRSQAVCNSGQQCCIITMPLPFDALSMRSLLLIADHQEPYDSDDGQ